MGLQRVSALVASLGFFTLCLAGRQLPNRVMISRFARGSSRYVQRQLASRAGGRSPSMSSAGVQRPSQNITAPARSLTAQPLPTSMEAICTGLAHRRMIKSGHSINLGRTFRRRSQTGRVCRARATHRHKSAGQTSIRATSRSIALALPVIPPGKSMVCQLRPATVR